jgi:hypothetical protein
MLKRLVSFFKKIRKSGGLYRDLPYKCTGQIHAKRRENLFVKAQQIREKFEKSAPRPIGIDLAKITRKVVDTPNCLFRVREP